MSTAMERYQGVILIRLQNAGSKSEGHYAFLVRDDDMSVVKLCREGAVLWLHACQKGFIQLLLFDHSNSPSLSNCFNVIGFQPICLVKKRQKSE